MTRKQRISQAAELILTCQTRYCCDALRRCGIDYIYFGIFFDRLVNETWWVSNYWTGNFFKQNEQNRNERAMALAMFAEIPLEDLE